MTTVDLVGLVRLGLAATLGIALLAAGRRKMSECEWGALDSRSRFFDTLRERDQYREPES